MKTTLLFFSLAVISAFAVEFKKQPFTKICSECKCVCNEIQNYAFNEWTHSWQPSYRSDSLRPGLCEDCYLIASKTNGVKHLSRPLNAYATGSYTSKYLEDIRLNYFKAQEARAAEAKANERRAIERADREIATSNYRLLRRPRVISSNE
jgi:hypothetical protein